MSKSILIIDDDEMVLDAVSSLFQELGFQVTACQSPREGVKAATDQAFDLVVSDLRMPDMDGAQVTRQIRTVRPNQKILILTAFPADPLASQALEAGAASLMRKPFEIEKILKILEG